MNIFLRNYGPYFVSYFTTRLEHYGHNLFYCIWLQNKSIWKLIEIVKSKKENLSKMPNYGLLKVLMKFEFSKLLLH